MEKIQLTDSKMKVKELKEKLEANTSEKLFGIDEQPEQNCPKVDKVINIWQYIDTKRNQIKIKYAMIDEILESSHMTRQILK